MISRPHVWIDKQSDYTLLLLHGTGADESDLLQLGELLAPEFNLLSPRGLVDENGMNRFFERTPNGEFVEESVFQAVSDLEHFLDQAEKEYGFDPKGLSAAGFSNGANTALALLMTSPQKLNAVVAFGSTKPLRSAVSADMSGKLVFIANGDYDPYAPAPITDAFVAELREAGAEVKLLSHPGGHQISPAHIQQINSELT